MNHLHYILSEADYNNNYLSLHNEWSEKGITTELIAKEKIKSIRFPNDTVCCLDCTTENRYFMIDNGKRFQCKKCGRKFSVFTKTWLDNTNLKPYQIWRFAFLVGEKRNKNSVHIADDVGITQKTSWWLLYVLKCALKEQKQRKRLPKSIDIKSQDEVLELLLTKTSLKPILKSQKAIKKEFKQYRKDTLLISKK